MHVYIQEIARNMARGALLRMQSIRMCLQGGVRQVSESGRICYFSTSTQVLLYLYFRTSKHVTRGAPLRVFTGRNSSRL
jgi:hypothetical protein